MSDGDGPPLVYVQMGRRRSSGLVLDRVDTGRGWKVLVAGRVEYVTPDLISRFRPTNGSNRVLYARLVAEWQRIRALMVGLRPHSTGRDARR